MFVLPGKQAGLGVNNGHYPPPSTIVDSTASEAHFFDPGQWTVVDETKDHPGRRKSSGFLQPIKHLSGRSIILAHS